MKEIFDRTSVRTFRNQLVEPQKLTNLFKAAMAAPSAGNQQPWMFYGVRSKMSLLRLATCGQNAQCVKDAPFAVVACYRSDVKYPELVHMDMSAAVQNILLAATSMGLGAVWLSVAPYEDRIAAVKNVLAIDDDVTPFAIIPIGYPAAAHKTNDRYDAAKVHFLN